MRIEQIRPLRGKAACIALLLIASFHPARVWSSEPKPGDGIKCPTNVAACVKRAQKRCPVNVVFIADRNTELGFSVYPKGAPITEKAFRGRPAYVVCGKQKKSS
jgi:hypothetical protein